MLLLHKSNIFSDAQSPQYIQSMEQSAIQFYLKLSSLSLFHSYLINSLALSYYKSHPLKLTHNYLNLFE